MKKKILIVEDESLIAFDLKLILTRADYHVCGISDSVKDALKVIEEQKPEMVLLDIFLKGPLNGIDLAKILTEKNIAFVYLSANFQTSILENAKATQPYGFLVKPFREKELLIALDVAFYRHHNSMESKLRQEQVFGNTVKSIMAEPIDQNQKLLMIVNAIQPLIPFDYLVLTMRRGAAAAHVAAGFLRIGFDDYQIIGLEELLTIFNITAVELKRMQDAIPVYTRTNYANGDDFKKSLQDNPLRKLTARVFQLQSFIALPLLTLKGEILTFTFFSRKHDCYLPDHLTLLNRIQQVLAVAIEDTWTSGITDTSIAEGLSEPEMPPQGRSVFDGIIGNSHQMLSVQDMISVVAPLDTSVLILGESGTGKERVAKSIYELSLRRNKPFVTVNCASLPANLIESELFGHEKGSFTGAFERRIGKFEQADKGTIFLDEIGEMPSELQVKLLRVLQEHEIERIGGRGAVKINVRIIAATNRNLEKEVEEGRFRLDLYYRLYVFPIMIPALRERVVDIPELVEHFVKHYARKTGKKVFDVSPGVLELLKSYHWPGNVRELEHLIERSVLLTNGPIITDVLLPRFHNPANQSGQLYAIDRPKTMDENAREHILSVLKKCNGKVSGAGGAAEILQIEPTTLHSRIKKLGIKKEDIT
nr:sigma 54-interacting transcriptional regulator [Mucilaginibacter sp. L294]